ncbi:hypothetical protein JHL21_00235 [Devosia sp. WQ 349]|uniref:hypothetical protein n=1 Tax=Devosia sp. WQ 349K1 TaxID=2800329 RepID=UPI00190559BB|nr:hypothetical protein [Devosia sp. WQ 349K1]MBK1792920.1 hypothetical protein [Devosia sp. WQ 349K1]
MQVIEEDQLSRVMAQKTTPVAIRRGTGYKLHVQLPYAEDNRIWLQLGMKSAPKWLLSQRRWELPSTHFNTFVKRALDRYSRLYVIQPYAEQEVCAKQCWDAQGHECQCSCMGANHGSGNGDGYFEVTDTFAVRWQAQRMGCRLMARK